MNDTTQQDDKTQVLQKIEEEHTASSWLGGEVELFYKVQKGTDHRGQERVVFRKKKETCMGGWIKNNVEEKVFKNYSQLVEFFENQWYDRVVAENLAEGFGEELGFKAEDIMYPVEKVAKEIQELQQSGEINIPARYQRNYAVEWMDKEYPDHYNREVEA